MSARVVVVGFGLVCAVAAQDAGVGDACYTAGSLAVAVFITAVVLVALAVLAYVLYRFYWKSRRGEYSGLRPSFCCTRTCFLPADNDPGGVYIPYTRAEFLALVPTCQLAGKPVSSSRVFSISVYVPIRRNPEPYKFVTGR